MSAGDEVTDREAILTLVGGIGTAVLIALLCLFGGGCIRIANVESFVTVPKDAVSFGVSNENER